MTQHRRYLGLAAAAFVTTLGLAAAVNVAVDPYALFGTPRVEGLTAVKPAAVERSRVTKPYQVERARPVTLIAGNSRAEIGLDPASRCWAEAERPVYNLGLPGASLTLQLATLRHAVDAGSVRTVVLTLDFLDFLRAGDTATAGEGGSGGETLRNSERRLRLLPDGSPNPDRWQQQATDLWKATLSLGALRDSAVTLASQRLPQAADLRDDGFNPARPYLGVIAAEGQAVLFRQKRKELDALFGQPGLRLPPRAEDSPELTALAATLDTLAVRGVRTLLVLNPYHAEYLAAVEDAGLWRDMRRWKEAVLAITEPRGLAVWDFNTLSAYSQEPVPAAGDRRSLLRWFWEPAHYRAELGELMLAAALGRDCAPAGEGMAAPAFGTRLTPEVLAAQAQPMRQAIIHWQAAMPLRAAVTGGEPGAAPVTTR
ncbi:hypothetical protein [Caenispirillum bisanense]|uniref:hypothetical protein n=1 Tax=Caenispirillum bisanense TaxID=414052 RepID=UPI0031D6ACC8